MSNKTVYLVSGANRGIGYALAATLAARPNTIVFAGARDPTAQSLKDLVAKHSNVHPIKLTSSDVADNAAAAAEIEKIAGHLDVVIANAGIAKHVGSLATTPLSEFRDHWEVNSLGLVVLFQAVQKLLFASPTGAPKLAYISSGAGSIGGFVNLTAAAYGASKATANYLVKALDVENPPHHIGDLARLGCNGNGQRRGGGERDAAGARTLSRIDAVTKETSGRFWNYRIETEGNFWSIASDEVPW
ncbi:hypothetical protein B0H14DRAFT_2570731 [Mycena olivaceomarginata]|nr:hypothetical protein B0H14DRAFT_2570731 [Mycena olivaceomarginata]